MDSTSLALHADRKDRAEEGDEDPGPHHGAHHDELELLEETESFKSDQSRLSCQLNYSDELDGMKLTIAPEE